MNSSISPVDIRPDHLEIVQDILREHLPAGFRVWVFGSRANWKTKDSSDLDLAMEGADALDYKAMVGLEVAFEESDLPYTVDVVDLNAVSPEFKNIVEAQRIPLPPAAPRKVSSEWRKVTLGELTENFDAIRVPVKESDRKPGPYPYYGASGVVDRVDGFLFDGQYLLIAEDGENLRTRATPIAFLADGRFWVNNHAHIVRGNHHADTRFLNYALSNLDISGYLTGSTMPKLTQRNMNQILLTVPPLREQRRIARILGALDDKIELNRRMNETLEAMARAVFQDWFVDFGPTRAKMEGQEPYLPPELWDLFPNELVDSELGEIPQGWKAGALSDYASLNQESWSKKNLPNEIEYVDLANTKWGTIESTQHFSGEAAPSRARRVLRSGDTIVGTVRPGNGSFSLVGRNGLTGSTGFAVLRPLRHWFRELVYLAATDPNNIERLTHRADGGAYPAVRPEVVAESQVVTPNEGTISLDHFSNVIRPLLDKMEKNQAEIRMLATLREELLPSLISGELNPAGD